ncbi:CFEM domain-containing protein [Colletotrichum karsti]|uniref:CFEM domain-containing protein n=1 Tax=Colletotrichum karsti TaxID=1095194 RepID=A0A9P6IGH6_9PEZI|nr:CFEM domain-containing protein [Colletotrichum karsti]KAF9882037.1 CFEM domain-containing protein [Colletotrichum karsti]
MLTLRLCILVGLLSLLSLTAAQSLADAPPCAIKCFGQALAQPDYASKTQAQLCVDQGFNNVVGACVQQACTVVESLSFLNITRTSCGLPEADYRNEARATSLGMFTVATFFFACRLAVKVLRFSPWRIDDTLMTVAYAFLIPFIVMIQYMIPQGLGLDIWVLNENQITSFLRLLLAVQTHYIFILAVIKASILYFFLRIFPDTKFRIAVWVTLAYDLFVGFIFIVLSFVQRQPTWLIWEGWRDKDPRGVVLDLNKLGLAHGGMNIALDVWMLVLPLTQLYKLNLKLRKKLGIMAMFCVGIFLTVVSIIRVHSLVYFATSSNATADARGTIIWSCIELCTGVVVSCMPNARQLLREGTRQFRDITTNLTQGTGASNPASQRALHERSLELRVAVNSPNATTAPGKGESSSLTTPTTSHGHSSFASDADLKV